MLVITSSGGELDGTGSGPHISKSTHLSDSLAHLARTPDARLRVHADVRTTLERVTARLFDRHQAPHVDWRPCAPAPRESGLVDPRLLIRSMANGLPRDAVVYADAGNAAPWAIHHLHSERWRGRLRLSLNYGSMGWAIGAAIGAALANRRPAVALVGDGAMLMAGQEFSVAVQERISCVFVVLNDSALGMVRHGQRLAGGGAINADLPTTNFAVMARAMGGCGIIVRCAEELSAIDWAFLFTRGTPTIIDVRIDPEDVPPIHHRVNALAR